METPAPAPEPWDPSLHRMDSASRPRPSRLCGRHVELRPLAEDDLVPLVDLLSHPEAAAWWPLRSVDELREDTFGSDSEFALAIEYEGHLVGLVIYDETLWNNYFSAGIDIAIDPTQRGRGLGPDALRTLIAWLITEGGHHRLTIDPAAENTPAIRAYEKVGFRPVGVMREYERGPDGQWRDSLLMDLLAREFTPED